MSNDLPIKAASAEIFSVSECHYTQRHALMSYAGKEGPTGVLFIRTVYPKQGLPWPLTDSLDIVKYIDEQRVSWWDFNYLQADLVRSLRKHAYSSIFRILPPKTEKFQMKNSGSFHISAQKQWLWVLVRTACEAVLTSTHNLCFEQK